MSAVDISWILGSAALVLLMQAGFACLEGGLVRRRNSANVVLKNLADFCVAALLFWASGFGIMFGASHLGLIGTTGFLPGEGSPLALDTAVLLVFQLVFCATAATIVSGAVAERASFTGYLVIAAVVGGLVYPLFGHWAWNGGVDDAPAGWLSAMGFRDFAGVGVVHLVGGGAALAAVLAIGPRRGRFDRLGPGEVAPPVRPSNVPLAALGTLLLLVGWMGFNGGSTLGVTEAAPTVLLNTLLGAAAGGLVACLLSRLMFGYVEVMPVLGGLLAGLVAITGGADVFSPGGAIASGAIGAIVAGLASRGLAMLKVDDAVDAIAVHAAAGVWGLLAIALFGRAEMIGDRWALLGTQAIGAGVALAWAAGVGYVIIRLVGQVVELRVPEAAERMGLDNYEHGHASGNRQRWTREDDRELGDDLNRLLAADDDSGPQRRAA